MFNLQRRGSTAFDSLSQSFVGNINQLVLRLEPYVKQLQATRGLIAEFVNPKYKDDSRTAFKSATRLECMMQVPAPSHSLTCQHAHRH